MTKIKHFSTGKANLCVVELPEGAKKYTVYHDEIIATVVSERTVETPRRGIDIAYHNINHRIPITSGNWSIIAPVKDITEEQARRIMPKKYTDNALGIKHEALKELHTLLQSIPIYTENPFGEMPRESQFMGDEWGIGYAEYQSKLREWRRAEKNVFRNSILLVNNETK